ELHGEVEGSGGDAAGNCESQLRADGRADGGIGHDGLGDSAPDFLQFVVCHADTRFGLVAGRRYVMPSFIHSLTSVNPRDYWGVRAGRTPAPTLVTDLSTGKSGIARAVRGEERQKSALTAARI